MNRLDIPSPPTQENKILCCLTREKKCLVTIGSSLLSFMLKKKVLPKSVGKKKKSEGAPGFEPGTSRSAVECSTTELYPHAA